VRLGIGMRSCFFCFSEIYAQILIRTASIDYTQL